MYNKDIQSKITQSIKSKGYVMKFTTLELGQKRLHEVVNDINTGVVQGFENWTSENIAANYAIDTISENDEEITEDLLDFHMDFLASAGAKFDLAKAVELALDSMSHSYKI